MYIVQLKREMMIPKLGWNDDKMNLEAIDFFAITTGNFGYIQIAHHT